jgi:hypothetical protein
VPGRGTRGSPGARVPASRSGHGSPGHGRGREPTHWLLVRGSAARRLEGPVELDAIRVHRTTRRPAVQSGDTAVLYAAVWQAVFATVEITGDPEHDAARDRWAWSFPLRALVAVPHLDLAPPVEAAGIFPQSLWRHSHIRLDEDRFATACDLVASAAGPPAGRR